MKQEASKYRLAFVERCQDRIIKIRVCSTSHNLKPLSETDLKFNLLKLLPQSSSLVQQLAVPRETEIANDPEASFESVIDICSCLMEPY